MLPERLEALRRRRTSLQMLATLTGKLSPAEEEELISLPMFIGSLVTSNEGSFLVVPGPLTIEQWESQARAYEEQEATEKAELSEIIANSGKAQQ